MMVPPNTLIVITLAIVLAVLVISLAMDLVIKHVYKYPKTPHQNTPETLGIPFEEIRLPTANSRHIYGWWIPAVAESSGPSPTLILAHGWGRNLERMMPYVQALHPKGYNLLAFDLRSHGSSDRDSYPNMLKFSEDIRAAIDFLVERSPNLPPTIGVVGLSVGGGAAIHAAATDQRIQVAVTVGAIAHPVEVMRSEFSKRGLPYYPLGWLVLKYLQLRIGVNFDLVAPVIVIPRTTSKVLLIHGEKDKVVPVDEGRRLLRSANPETTRLWVVPGKGHSDCHQHPDFWTRVSVFLQAAFQDRPLE